MMLFVIAIFFFKNISLHKQIEDVNIYISSISKQGSYLQKLQTRYDKKNADKKINKLIKSSGFDGKYITSSISKRKAHITIDAKVNELGKIHKFSNKILATSYNINTLNIQTKDDYNKTFTMDITF